MAGGPGAAPRIILFDGGAGDPAPGFEVASLAEACEHGERRLLERPGLVEERMRAVAPGDVASIIYTSGTTGDPKGVMLTHGNFASNVDACLAILPFSTSDLTISLLPLSHVLERTVEYCYLAGGASIAFAESVEKALPVIREIRPTVFTAVPRVLEKLHSRVLDGVKSSPASRRRLFAWALASGREKLALELARRPVPLLLEWKCRLADRLVFSRIRERLGGRVRFMLSGGAPLPREITEFFLAMGITVFEGYGMTETAPVISVNTFGRLRPGTVGQPIPGVEVRIAGDGEILVRGPNVMKGYYGDPGGDARGPARGVSRDGGHRPLRRGGIPLDHGPEEGPPDHLGGEERPAPADRERHPPEPLHRQRHPLRRPEEVPDRARRSRLRGARPARGLARASGASRPPRSSPGRRSAPSSRRRSPTATASFSEHERVRRFTLLERDFDQDHGEVTPTLKLRRRVVAEHFRTVIEAMYGSS